VEIRCATMIPVRIRPPRLGVDVKSHSNTTLYILYEGSHMKYTGWCQNDFNV
jgi:hypothetical protein